ncbi:MAG: PilZ domain-containing protein [Planctomycetes bacterium]|nr:PilZ domain-containing protein [Planctomycetota bacterium]
MLDQRQQPREESIRPGISALLQFADGSLLDCVVIDISDTGAKIAGETHRLATGDEYTIVLVVQSHQKVSYRCIVRHIDPESACFGIEFLSKPQIVKKEEPKPDEVPAVHSTIAGRGLKRCPVDGKVFPVDYCYCPFDKSNLVLDGC